MLQNYYIAGVAVILYILVLCFIPFRIKKYGKREKSDNETRFWVREIGILLFALILILLIFRIDFGFFSNVVLCGCGVIGAFIATKELTAQKDEDEE